MKMLNVILLVLLAFGTAGYAENIKAPAVLLQQGIYAEETEGNLDKAMGIYGQIRKDYNDVERISARATYQLGMCHLKKGDKETAAKYFEEVVSYFPDQKSVVQKAQQQLDKLGIKKDADKNIYDILGQVSSYIGSKYGEICAEAGVKKLYSNSHIYVVDKDFILRKGGMGYAYNWTDKTITEHLRLSSTTSTNQKFYDITGNLMDIEIVPIEQRKGYYDIYWNPKEPLQPNSFFNYGWASDGSAMLPKTNQDYQLKMQNHPGEIMFETFFLVVPEGTTIKDKSEVYTGKGNANDWDIYWWKKEVPENTNHVVNVTLKKPIEYTQEAHYDIEPNGLMNFWMPMKIKNNGQKSIETTQFINSDFVNLTTIVDSNNRPVKFTATHTNDHYQYVVTFNPPVQPGEEFVYTCSGTINGLIYPVAEMNDTYQYYMKHHPSSGQPTLRIETYLLPQGAEIISTVPPTMKRTEKEGRIELRIEEVIPPDGSITTSFEYRLTGKKISEVYPPDINKTVQKAVLTISSCTEADSRVLPALNSLKGLDQNQVISEIAKYLDDDRATVRRSAIYILYKSEFENITAAEPKLLQLCSHQENMTRGMAALALGTMKVQASFETLKDMTLNHKDGYVRRCAAYALGLYGDKAALPTLEKALNDPDSMVKNNALAAITMLNKVHN